jgi:hypothetical protein
MALVETFLLDYLLDDPEIAARIGHGSPVKYALYPEVLKDETCFPAITYTRISSTHDELLDGGSDLAFGTFQFSCWSLSAMATWELAAVLRARMIGLGGNGFQKAGILDERSDYEPDTKLYRTDVDIRIGYSESSPA